VTAHYHAAPARLTREYQGDHRRYVLTRPRSALSTLDNTLPYQKFGPGLSDQIRRHRKPVSTTWLVNETYVKIRAGGTICTAPRAEGNVRARNAH
jgi:hypothetical protein